MGQRVGKIAKNRVGKIVQETQSGIRKWEKQSGNREWKIGQKQSGKNSAGNTKWEKQSGNTERENNAEKQKTELGREK